MRVVWTPRASARLEQIGDAIAEDNPSAAVRTVEEIVNRTSGLAQFPYKGRFGRVAGTHELVVGRTSYIVIYRVGARDIEVVGVLHGAQLWPLHF